MNSIAMLPASNGAGQATPFGSSPGDLPARLRLYLGRAYLARLVKQIEDYGALSLHMGTGVYIRNFLRTFVRGWTDQELDDCWYLVVLAAAGREARRQQLDPVVA